MNKRTLTVNFPMSIDDVELENEILDEIKNMCSKKSISFRYDVFFTHEFELTEEILNKVRMYVTGFFNGAEMYLASVMELTENFNPVLKLREIVNDFQQCKPEHFQFDGKDNFNYKRYCGESLEFIVSIRNDGMCTIEVTPGHTLRGCFYGAI